MKVYLLIKKNFYRVRLTVSVIIIIIILIINKSYIYIQQNGSRICIIEPELILYSYSAKWREDMHNRTRTKPIFIFSKMARGCAESNPREAVERER